MSEASGCPGTPETGGRACQESARRIKWCQLRRWWFQRLTDERFGPVKACNTSSTAAEARRAVPRIEPRWDRGKLCTCPWLCCRLLNVDPTTGRITDLRQTLSVASMPQSLLDHMQLQGTTYCWRDAHEPTEHGAKVRAATLIVPHFTCSVTCQRGSCAQESVTQTRRLEQDRADASATPSRPLHIQTCWDTGSQPALSWTSTSVQQPHADVLASRAGRMLHVRRVDSAHSRDYALYFSCSTADDC